MSPAVLEFRGPHRFLSNFWTGPVPLDGRVYPSAEHAYQAAKSRDPARRAACAALPTPGAAKRWGRTVPLRPDWEAVKLLEMTRVLRAKFPPGGPLTARLLATGDARLAEGNRWGDRYWGEVAGVGRTTWAGSSWTSARAVDGRAAASGSRLRANPRPGTERAPAAHRARDRAGPALPGPCAPAPGGR